MLRRPQPAALQKPLVIAHRGAAGHAPENTLAAFKLAIALGADGIEMDVQLTSDGYPVVIHDARVNRTTDGKGAVSRLTLSRLQSLDAGSWFDRRKRIRLRERTSRSTRESFSGEAVPTLESALSILAPLGLARFYVELKAGQANEQLLEAVIPVIRALRVERKVTLLSFDHAAVKRAKESNEDIRTAATFPAKRKLISTRSLIRAADSASVDEVALHYRLASRRTVEALHNRGFSVSVWTANSRLAMKRLVVRGVDSIMTDFPDRLRDILNPPLQSPEVRRRG